MTALVRRTLNALPLEDLIQLGLEFKLEIPKNVDKKMMISKLINPFITTVREEKFESLNKKSFHELGDPYLLGVLKNLTFSDIVSLRQSDKAIDEKLQQAQFQKIIDQKFEENPPQTAKFIEEYFQNIISQTLLNNGYKLYSDSFNSVLKYLILDDKDFQTVSQVNKFGLSYDYYGDLINTTAYTKLLMNLYKNHLKYTEDKIIETVNFNAQTGEYDFIE